MSLQSVFITIVRIYNQVYITSFFIHIQGAPSLEQQLCVFNRLPQSSPLPQLRKEFSKGHKRVFSCPTQYIEPSVEESMIVHGNTEYLSMHKPL